MRSFRRGVAESVSFDGPVTVQTVYFNTTCRFFESMANDFPGGGCGMFFMYPAAATSFREAGTCRFSTLNLRNACVNSARTFAQSGSAAVPVAAAFDSDETAAVGGALSPHPRHNETTQHKKSRRDLGVVCCTTFKIQAASCRAMSRRESEAERASTRHRSPHCLQTI